MNENDFDAVQAELEAWRGLVLSQSRKERLIEHAQNASTALQAVIDAPEGERDKVSILHGVKPLVRPVYPSPADGPEAKARYIRDLNAYEALLQTRRSRGIIPLEDTAEAVNTISHDDWLEERELSK